MKSGWVTKKLGEVCEIKLGKTPPRDDYSFWDRQKSSGYVWVSTSDMASLTDGQIIDSKEYITNKAIEEAGVPIVKKGTLLLSFKLTIGRTAIAGRDLSTNEAIAALPLKQEFAQLIDLHYLVFYFAAFDWYLFAAKDDKMLGKTLNKKRLATVPVLIPPLAEQKRIVAKVDAAFEKIDKLKANAEKNLANAKDLFQSALDEAMRPKEGWVEKRLGEVYNFIDYRGKTPTKIKNGVPLVTARNVRMGYLDYSVRDFISYEEYETRQSRGVAHKGDLLFTTEAPLGFVAIADLDEFSTGQRLITFQQYENSPYELLNKFYFYYLQSKDFQSEIRKQATGATAQGIKASRLKDILVVVIPLLEQERIVNRLDLLAEKIKTIEQNYTKQIADCVEMRQAVLREAFEGRL